MKKLLLLAGLALATCSATHAQYVYSNYMPPMSKPRAAATDPAGKPEYAGLYINGQQLMEVNCYGFDSYDLVVPNFASSFANADEVLFLIGVYQYDQNGKAVTLHPDYIERITFEGARLQALLEKYQGKGYIVLTRSNQLNEYNEHRYLLSGNDNQLISAASSSLNCAKYTRTDPAKSPQTVIMITVMTSKIVSYKTNPDGSPFAVRDYAALYRSPAIMLRDRVYTKNLTLKGSLLVGKQLPEMQAENCTTNKGIPVSMSAIKKVGEGGYGEEIEID